MAVNVGSAEGYLDLDISRFLAKLNTAQSAASSMAAKTTATMNKQLAGVGKSFTSAGKTLTKNVTLPIVGIGAAAVAVTSKFDSAMSKVSAVSGATGKELDKLRDKAKEMGAKTKFSATESAEAFNYMAMAGWKTEDMLSGIEGIMNLAAASGEDLATTSDIVTDALTAFGLEAKDSGHFADVLAANASNANTNVAMLGESFKYIAPVAGALGYSIEDVNLALGLMANSGIKASQAGTTLRGALTRMAKPTGEVQKAMDKYGLSLTDARGNMLPLRDVMGQLREKFSTLSKAEQAQAATTLFGKSAMSGMLAIINSSEKDWNKLANAIDNADGTAERMAETMLDNLGGQITILKSALEGLAIRIGEALMPTIKSIVQSVQDFVDKLNQMDDATLNNIIRISAFVAAVGPALAIFGKLLTLYTSIPGKINGAFKAFGVLKTAILGVSAPVLAIVAVVGVLVGAFITLWNTSGEFRAKIIQSVNAIKVAFDQFKSSIIGTLQEAGLNVQNFGDVISKIAEVIKTVWLAACNVIAPVFIAAFSIVQATIKSVLKIITGVFRVIVGIFTGNGSMILSGLKTLLSGVISLFTNLPRMLLSVLGNIMSFIGSWLASVVKNIASKGLEMGQSFVTNAINFFKQLPNKLAYWFGYTLGKIALFVITVGKKAIELGSNFINNTVNFFKQLPNKIWTWLQNTISRVTQWATSMKTKAKDAGSSFVKNVISFIKNLPSNVWNWLKDTISKLPTFVAQMKAKAKEAANGFVNSIKNGFTNLPSQMATIGKNIIQGLWNGISGLKDWVISKVKSMGSSILQGVKDALGIKSPSQRFADEVGKPIVQGIAQGMGDESVQQEVITAGQSLTQRSWDAIKSAFGVNIDDLKVQTKNGFESAWNTMLTAQTNSINAAIQNEKNYHNGIKKDRKAAAQYGKKVYNDYLKSNIKGLSKMKKGSKEYNKALKNNAKTVKAAKKAEKKAAKESLKAQQALTAEYNKQVNVIKNELIKEINNVMAEYNKAVTDAQNGLFSSMSPFEAFESTTQNSTETILENSKKQVQAMQEWNAEIDSIGKRIAGQSWASAFMEELRNAGYKSLADVKVLGEMSNEQWTQFISLQSQKYEAAQMQARQMIDMTSYQQEINALTEQATNDLNTLYAEYAAGMKQYGAKVSSDAVAVGQNLVNGMLSGMNQSQPALYKYVESMCKELIKLTKKRLKIKSPSQVFADEIGQMIPLGIAEGVDEAAPVAETEMQSALDNINLSFNAFDGQVGITKFIEEFKKSFGDMNKWFNEFSAKFVVGIDKMVVALERFSRTMARTPLMDGGYVSVKGYGGPERHNAFKEASRYGYDRYVGRGDTFNFYSPKPIDEIEAARLLKKTKQEMAERI